MVIKITNLTCNWIYGTHTKYERGIGYYDYGDGNWYRVIRYPYLVEFDGPDWDVLEGPSNILFNGNGDLNLSRMFVG